MIGRRSTLLMGMGLAMGRASRPASAALPVPPGATLAFRVVRNGSEIGRHTTTFKRDGATLTVRTEVDAQVSLVSIPIVRYHHRVVETWQGDTLIGLNGETEKTGQHEWVKAQRGADGLMVLGSRTERYVAPEPAGATTYWNRHVLDGPMISLEDGVLLRPLVRKQPAEKIPTATGATIAADHYNLSGPFSVDLWYDQDAVWAGLATTVKDGSTVHYERL